MKKLKILATGGTIAYKWDAALGGAVAAVTGEELVEAIPQLNDVAQVEVSQFSNVASQTLRPEDFLAYSKECQRIALFREADGIVLTMGTATLAECSYMLDLQLQQGVPVVVTGAMRTQSHPSPDGPSNILDAAIAAVSEHTRDVGVLVCANGELHEPRDVLKTNSVDLATYRSIEFGPIGFVRNNQTVIFRRPTIKDYIPVDKLTARVAIVPAVEGDDGKLVDAAAEFSDGIVLVGFAPGCVPPDMTSAIARAIEKGCAIVLVTRSYGGSLGVGVYAQDIGGIAHLMSMGVLPGGSLRAPKAQIKLMVALSSTRDPEKLTSLFPNI